MPYIYRIVEWQNNTLIILCCVLGLLLFLWQVRETCEKQLATQHRLAPSQTSDTHTNMDGLYQSMDLCITTGLSTRVTDVYCGLSCHEFTNCQLDTIPQNTSIFFLQMWHCQPCSCLPLTQRLTSTHLVLALISIHQDAPTEGSLSLQLYSECHP